MVSFLINLLLVLAFLSIVTVIHEFGHFLMARIVGAGVEEFAIGMGPVIFKRKIKDFDFTIRAFPIGGFVRITGEVYDEEEEPKKKNDPKNLQNKSKRQRFAVFFGGVLMNLITAIIMSYVLIGVMGFKFPLEADFREFEPYFGKIRVEKISDQVEYDGLVEDGAAFNAELPERGTIKSINGVTPVYSYEFRSEVANNAGRTIPAIICVENECKDFEVKISDDGYIGMYILQNYTVNLEYEGWERWSVGLLHVANWFKFTGHAISGIFSEAAQTGDYEPLAVGVSGPVGLFVVIDQFRKAGVIPLIALFVDINLTLFVMNLLPIPALDGGRLMFLILEGIRRKPLNKKLEAFAIQITFILLMLLILGIFLKDIIFIDKIKDFFQ